MLVPRAMEAVSRASEACGCRDGSEIGSGSDLLSFTRSLFTSTIHPGINGTINGPRIIYPMNQAHFARFTAFEGQRRLASGSLAEVALAVKKACDRGSSAPVLVIDDSTGRTIDLDL